MLNNLTLENFKAFQKLDNLKIKPITILCGTNSCGKSSILQSILLMKQTLESKNLNQNLLLNGGFTKLGYFEDIIYKKEKKNTLVLNYNFNFSTKSEILNKRFPIELPLQEILRGVLDNIDFLKDSEWLINYTVELKGSEAKISDGFDTLKIKNIFLTLSQKKEIDYVEILNINIKALDNGEGYEIEKNGLKGVFEIKFANLFPTQITPKQGTLPDKQWNYNTFFSIFRFPELLKKIVSTYTYLGPLRGEPEREYIYRDEVVEIGNKGENAAFLYLSEKDNIIKDHFFCSSSGFIKIKEMALKDYVKAWMSIMQMGNINAEIIERIIYLSLNASKYDGTKVGIADVGFGVSQIFPILLEGLRMEKGGTLLLEQPEIHLHPDLQMQMADYFVSLALSDKNVLVETHSDHIIHRLVRRIVEDEELDLKNKIAIYFIKPSENGAVYEEINIDETKGITNWPTNFFDQAANEQMRIMQAGLKKRKHLRNNTKS